MKFLLMALMLTVLSCNPQAPLMNVNDLYKKDMIVNGEEGMALVPYKDKYNFHVEARGDLNAFVMTSCSREYTKEKAWNVIQTVKKGPFGWIKRKITKKREVKFDYIPTIIENNGKCPLLLSGINEDGQHSFAYVDFDNPIFKLPAEVMCNGFTMNAEYFKDKGLTGGTSLCQAKVGTLQAIKFNREVTYNAPCNVKKTKNLLLIKAVRGLCTIIFKDKHDAMHKLTIFGYNKFIMR